MSTDRVTHSRGVGIASPNGSYLEFLRAKAIIAKKAGFDIQLSEINPILKEHQKLIVQWAIAGGRRAIFAAFGLGKSVMQLEIIRIVLKYHGGKGLLVMPLGVRQEFKRDAKMLGLDVTFIRRNEEITGDGIYLTNYESIRDGKLNPGLFTVTSLDEADILRGFGGSKTFREFMRVFDSVRYKFVATATPSPNEFIELLAYSAYLGIQDVSQSKTRFFKRNSEKADTLTIHPHKEKEFWFWVSTWSIFIQSPSDLGCDSTGYDMPELKVRWHEVRPKDTDGGEWKDGQRRLFRNAALGLSEAAKEKRDSLDLRISKMQELLADDPESHCIIWHDLEVERHAIQKAIPEAVSVYGSLDLDKREDAIIKFSDGGFKYLSAKPSVAGSGCNFQRHCHRAIYLGIGFKFKDFIQALHRILRYLQTEVVEIDIIYTEGERDVRKSLERKWKQHNEMRDKMTAIIKEFGLSDTRLSEALTRALGVERVEVTGERFKIVNNDCVLETQNMEENSVGLIVTSIPFSTQYEYSQNFADFGHTDSNAHFFEQMDFLTPNLLKVLQPGRIAAIHVKDRIVPGGMTGLGFQTVYPFHMKVIEHYCKHGFAYMGMKTVVTDVVRENNQTYRLGWTEQCKDGTKMGVGMPEYLLLFRKPQSSTEKSYADIPVIKEKDKYTRSRWQIDAHGFERSSGDRLLKPEELKDLEHNVIFQFFKKYSLENVYDFEYHVKIGEELETAGRLPVTFMLLQPASWHPDVWTDITRMLTLNGLQYAKGKEMHLCPMQIDLVDRVIVQMSNEGDLVFDPFGGLGTVPYRAILKGRKGMAVELSHSYFLDACMYCKAAEYEMEMPSLFDVTENQNQFVPAELESEMAA